MFIETVEQIFSNTNLKAYSSERIIFSKVFRNPNILTWEREICLLANKTFVLFQAFLSLK